MFLFAPFVSLVGAEDDRVELAVSGSARALLGQRAPVGGAAA